MRVRAAVAALCLALPGVAPAASELSRPPGSPAECARLHKQIAHFEGMVERAEARGNELWTNGMQDHVDRLREEQRTLCPDDAADNAAKEAFLAFMNLLKVAGQAALSYFTFGAL
jgi:hypothetical protein